MNEENYNGEEFNSEFEDVPDDTSEDPLPYQAQDELRSDGWNYIEDFETTVSFDTVDQMLLQTARAEIPAVMEQIKNEIPGCTNRTILTQNDFFNFWFRQTLADSMIRWIFKFTKKSVSVAEIGRFLQVELYLSAYRCSPSEFYHSQLGSIYKVRQDCMSQRDYMFILNALSGNTETDRCTTVDLDSPTWKAKYTKNKDVERLLNSFRTKCAEIAFVPGCSKVGVDDDLNRHRSRAASEAGFSLVNNLKKGMGIIHHGGVSVTSRLYLGGQYQLRGQSVLDCMTMIQRALSGSGCDNQIDLEETMFFYDRGYGGPDGIVNQTTLERNALIVGTSIRTPSYPFNFGTQSATDRRKLVPENGAYTVYWAEKVYRYGEVSRRHYAFAFRDGLGKVVLMHGSGATVRPGEFVYITKNGRGIDQLPEDNERCELFIGFEQENILRLTTAQRSPEWFLLRRFRLTATAAHDMWNAVRNDDIIADHVSQVLDLLCIAHEKEKVQFVNDPFEDEINDEMDFAMNSPISPHRPYHNELENGPSSRTRSRTRTSSQRTTAPHESDHSQHNIEPLFLENMLVQTVNQSNDHINAEYNGPPSDASDFVLPPGSDSSSSNESSVDSNESSRSSNSSSDDDEGETEDDDDIDAEEVINTNANGNEIAPNDAAVALAMLPFPYTRTQISAMKKQDAKFALQRLEERTTNENGRQMSGKEMKARLRAMLEAYEQSPTTAHNTGNGGGGTRPQRRNLNNVVIQTSNLHLKLLHVWFMAPLQLKASHATKVGSSNESNIMKAFPIFMHNNRQSTNMAIIRIKEYGLLCHRRLTMAAFSPDGIVHARTLDEDAIEFLALLEMKTKVSPKEEYKETLLAEKFGRFCTVRLQQMEDGARFKELIPDVNYRTQVLHGMCCGGLSSAFYVVASTTKIIRVVYISTTPYIIRTYCSAFRYQWNEANLHWIDSGTVPEIAEDEYSNGFLRYVTDKQTLKFNFDLWKCINNKVIERQAPLPTAKFIHPKLVAVWNRCKGPIDLYSRFLFNIKARHPNISATGTVWLRLIMTTVYNAFITYSLNKTQRFLRTCKSFHDFQVQRTRNTGEFRCFVVHLADNMCLFDVNVVVPVVENAPEAQQKITITYYGRRMFYPGGPKDWMRLTGLVNGHRHSEALISKCSREPKQTDNTTITKRKRGPQHCCAFCCGSKHILGDDGIYMKCKERNAFRTRYHCPVCNVALCHEPHYGGESCWDLWHSLPEIPVCCMNATLLNIVKDIPDANNQLNEQTINLATDTRVTHEVLQEAIRVTNAGKGYVIEEENKNDNDDEEPVASPPPRSVARGTFGQRVVVNDVESTLGESNGSQQSTISSSQNTAGNRNAPQRASLPVQSGRNTQTQQQSRRRQTS